eukprot:10016116-Ditylum_brightwellii.AAC.1
MVTNLKYSRAEGGGHRGKQREQGRHIKPIKQNSIVLKVHSFSSWFKVVWRTTFSSQIRVNNFGLIYLLCGPVFPFPINQ